MLDTEGRTWVAIELSEPIPVGEARAVTAGTVPLTIANVDGTLHALAGRCPHRGGPLGDGRLCGSELSCPWHGMKFDVRTGEATMPTRAFAELSTFEVRSTAEGSIEVSIAVGSDTED